MKLIRELNENVDVLVESKEGKNYLYLEGIIMQSEIVNRNGRKYPKRVMESALNRYITEKVENRTAYGELGHPANPTINPDRISHMFESVYWSGNDVIGRAKVFDTDLGMTIQKIHEGGGRIGMSSRGLGSLKRNNGLMEVQDDFYIATAGDAVTDPSAPKAWVNGIREDVEWILDRGIWTQQQVEEAHTEIDSAYSTRDRELREEKILKLFQNFMESLK